MKKSRRCLSVLLVLMMLLSTMSMVASASNCTDTTISNIQLSMHYFSYPISARAKTDTTPVFLHIKDVTHSYAGVAVQALGTNSSVATANNVVNLTYSNGTLVDQVFCIENWKYSIHTLIYEEGYDYASLRFRGGISGGNILGEAVWSPDSVGTYNDP